MKTIRNFVRDESGATMIEYGLIAALVAVAAITALTTMGESISGIFTSVSGKIDGAKPSS